MVIFSVKSIYFHHGTVQGWFAYFTVNKEMKGDVQYRYFFAEVFLQHPVSKTRNKYK